MEGHVAMEECKDPNPGHSSENVEAGFEKHGLSVPISPPREQECRSLPVTPQTPQFGHKTPGSAGSSSLGERMQARAGFKVPKLCLPFSAAAGADDNSGAPSPFLTIPPGLSPASLLESPVFVSNAMGQPSPTTGTLFTVGNTNDNDQIRFGGPPVEDSPNAFSFKPLDLKCSHYTAALKEQNQPVQEANLLGQLNQQNHIVPNNMNNDSKISRGTGAGNEHLPPSDHGQTAEGGDAREDYPTMAVTATTPEEDGYNWRKYGQKQVKHSEHPRSYFKCTHPDCVVKKKVERSHDGNITEIIYKGAHNHPKPTPSRPRPGSFQQPMLHPFGDAGVQADAAADNSPGSQQAWRAGVQDVVDATSPPSVPGGEHYDSSASMQQVECAHDVTSAPSGEVDGDDRVTHGSMSHGRPDAEGDELESKRRKLEAANNAIDMTTASRAFREPRVVIQTTSDVDVLDDGYRWRKYGQKVVKGNPNPRSYYKCTDHACTVRKHVERAAHDAKSVITTYEGKHNHEVPAARNQYCKNARPSPVPQLGTAAAMRHLGGCGVPFGLALPSRDPLAPMGNYPPYASAALGGVGPASLPSLPTMPPPPAALGGLNVPMQPSSGLHYNQQQLLRHRQAMQAAALVTSAPMVADVNADGTLAGAAPPPVYQQMMRSGLRLGHQM